MAFYANSLSGSVLPEAVGRKFLHGLWLEFHTFTQLSHLTYIPMVKKSSTLRENSANWELEGVSDQAMEFSVTEVISVPSAE